MSAADLAAIREALEAEIARVDPGPFSPLKVAEPHG